MTIDKINEINIDISEKDGKIVCSVYILPIGRLCRTKIRISSSDVSQFAERSGHKNLLLLQGPAVIYNYVPEEDSSGVWIFEKRATTRKKTTKSRAKTPSNIKK